MLFNCELCEDTNFYPNPMRVSKHCFFIRNNELFENWIESSNFINKLSQHYIIHTQKIIIFQQSNNSTIYELSYVVEKSNFLVLCRYNICSDNSRLHFIAKHLFILAHKSNGNLIQVYNKRFYCKFIVPLCVFCAFMCCMEERFILKVYQIIASHQLPFI